MRSEWTQWKYVLRAYVGAVNPDLLAPLDAAEERQRQIAFNALTEEEQVQSRTVSFILSQLLSGAPLQLIMNVEGMNGSEM